MEQSFAELIQLKKTGQELSDTAISRWIEGVTAGSIPDYQTSAMLMAIYFKGMTARETSWLTHCISTSGDIIDLSSLKGVKCDKHSSGGVADTVSIPLIAIAASCGAVMPKMSGRGLGHTGGTIDKLEAIPGFDVNLTPAQFSEVVNRWGGAIMAQTGDVAVADKKLYALRDVTATVDSVPLIASSIMGKKLASGADVIVLDVKWGSGAFMDSESAAIHLAETMVDIGEDNGKRTVAYVTDMNEPLGNAVGNALEVLEAVEVLRGRGPRKLRDVILTLSDEILLQSGLAKTQEQARMLGLHAIDDGSALRRLANIIKAQGGDPSFIDDPELLPQAAVKYTLHAPRSGFVTRIDARGIGEAAMHLGAGRQTKEDTIDLAVGLVLEVKTGDWMEKGQTIGSVFARTMEDARKCEEEILAALTLDGTAAPAWQTIVARITRQDGVVMYEHS